MNNNTVKKTNKLDENSTLEPKDLGVKNWEKAKDAGELYYCFDETFVQKQEDQLEILYDYNATRPKENEKRQALLKKLFGSVGQGLYIEPPLHANWGINTFWGNNNYANFGLTLVDDGVIEIGDNNMFAPNVIIAGTGHPVNLALRKKMSQFSIPVKIGNNVWVGAGVIILPGVKIGDNSVIGAGSVVTKDIPENVVAFGTPCKVIREIGKKDDIYYFKNKKIDPKMLDYAIKNYF